MPSLRPVPIEPRTRGAFAALSVAAVLASSGAARADVMLNSLGGDGGRAFTARCEEGRLLVGVQLRAGDDIDAIRPVCAFARTPTLEVDPEPYAQAFGGDGGAPADVLCPKDTPVVVRMDIDAEGIDGLVVNAVRLYCGAAVATQTVGDYPSAQFAGPIQKASDSLLAVGRAPLRSSVTDTCPDGLVGVGVWGRSGDRLDALGLVCGPPVLQRRLGRAKRESPPTPVDRARETAIVIQPPARDRPNAVKAPP